MPILKAWYLDVDLNDSSLAVRPYLSSIAGGKEGLVPFVQHVGAYAGVNGGYFDVNSATSYAAVVYPGEVLAQNVAVLSRSGILYPATRSFFSITNQRTQRIDWIYHFGNRVSDIYTYAQPTPNSSGNPAPVPDTTTGTRYLNLLAGIGGGPTLVKGGVVNVTYNEEVFFGSGVGLDNQDPRTAVGRTAGNHTIMLVADGRSLLSNGVSLPELGGIMVSLGCVEAMNLDGGGSSQMAVGDSLINLPLGSTFMRPVPTILAVVRAESLGYPATAALEKVIDTGDPECTLAGAGWFASANSGYYGSTPSMLNPKGTGDAYAQFSPTLPGPAYYDLYGWWVAATNRCSDTPFIIHHEGQRDTIRVDQTVSGSRWNYVGTYLLGADSVEDIRISNAATAGTYIVADAIRLVSYDTTTVTHVGDVTPVGLPLGTRLHQNYPNPFNPATVIRYRIGRTLHVRLEVFDLLGRRVAVLADGVCGPGEYRALWNAEGFSTGLYVYRLSAGSAVVSRRMILLR